MESIPLSTILKYKSNGWYCISLFLYWIPIFHSHLVPSESLSLIALSLPLPLTSPLCIFSPSLPSITIAISLPKVCFYSPIRFLFAWICLYHFAFTFSALNFDPFLNLNVGILCFCFIGCRIDGFQMGRSWILIYSIVC